MIKDLNDKIIDRNYGSIPHVSTSKMSQQADKKIGISQENILTTKTRDWKDLIIVTEKLDGSNVGVVNKNGVFLPISRAGYHTDTSTYEQHKQFTKYVNKNIHLFNWLPVGWRVSGEWCVMAHGTIYDITNESPFCAFDIFDHKNNRILYLDFVKLCSLHSIPTVALLHIGQPISIKNSIKLLGSGIYGKPEKPEGFVYRVERENRVDFLAKWVRHDKEDGKYMKDDIWNKGYDIACQGWQASG